MTKIIAGIVLALLRILGIIADKRREERAKESGRNETIVEARRAEDERVANAKAARDKALRDFDARFAPDGVRELPESVRHDNPADTSGERSDSGSRG